MRQVEYLHRELMKAQAYRDLTLLDSLAAALHGGASYSSMRERLLYVLQHGRTPPRTGPIVDAAEAMRALRMQTKLWGLR